MAKNRDLKFIGLGAKGQPDSGVPFVDPDEALPSDIPSELEPYAYTKKRTAGAGKHSGNSRYKRKHREVSGGLPGLGRRHH